MESREEHRRIVTGWIYVPGLLMILVGTSILLFPHLFPSIVAGCFILTGLLLIQLLRGLRKVAARIRAQLEIPGDPPWESSPAELLPRRVYTSHIN